MPIIGGTTKYKTPKPPKPTPKYAAAKEMGATSEETTFIGPVNPNTAEGKKILAARSALTGSTSAGTTIGQGGGAKTAPEKSSPASSPAPGPWESGTKVGKWKAGAAGQWTGGGGTGTGGGGGGMGGKASSDGTKETEAACSQFGFSGTHAGYELGAPANGYGGDVSTGGGGGGTGAGTNPLASSKAQALKNEDTASTRRLGLKKGQRASQSRTKVYGGQA